MLQTKFTIPPFLRKYYMQFICHMTNSHRYMLTKKYYDSRESIEKLLENVPPIRISGEEWRELIQTRSTAIFDVSRMFTFYNQQYV